MKKIFVLLAVFLIISCQEDEIKYSNAAWSGANGIVKPDTVAKVTRNRIFMDRTINVGPISY